MAVLHGFAPWGLGVEYQTHRNVRIFAGATLDQHTGVPRNMWFGPPTYTLLWYGAKYTPCMRREPVFVNASNAVAVREENFGDISHSDPDSFF